MATKQQLQEEISQLRERVAVLEAELAPHRSVHQFIITTPPTQPAFPQYWWQNPITCGYGVDTFSHSGN